MAENQTISSAVLRLSIELQNISGSTPLPSLDTICSQEPLSSFSQQAERDWTDEPSVWSFKLLLLATTWIMLLGMCFYVIYTQSQVVCNESTKRPSQVPYYVPIIGNLGSYLFNASQLASNISRTFGLSTIVRLNLLTKDVYLVSGAEYLNALWKNTGGLTSSNGINIALHNMFATPKSDMQFFEADRSGITLDPHPRSARTPEDRVFYLMHKATVDCLAGQHLSIAAERFQAGLNRRIQAVPVRDSWVEMDDLFGFLRPIISFSTIEAMCGARFLDQYPSFVQDFWYFNSSMPRLLQRWPRWMMPRAWLARDKCISVMKDWRKNCDIHEFDGNEMILRRWSYFSKMQGLSDHGVACSDLGILWGMNSNSMPATFWLLWHLFKDASLLRRATSEATSCLINHDRNTRFFNATRLCNRPLLQSAYTETLRKYVAVYIIRKPEHEEAQVLDYRIPKDKMIVVSSATAHTDPRNWNLGESQQHPVQEFWAERFLVYKGQPPQGAGSPPFARTHSAPQIPVNQTKSSDRLEPTFSFNGYSGAWVPFGGGIHQCPGRHWVKSQMLLSFAMINAAFDIDVHGGNQEPNLDMSKYGLGALQPAEKVAFRIRRKEVI